MDVAGPFTLTVPAYPATEVELDTHTLSGRVAAVGIAVHGASGDFAIATKGSDGIPAQDILTKSGINADGWFYPQALGQGTDGADLTGWYTGVPICDRINIDIANAEGGDVFDVTFLLE